MKRQFYQYFSAFPGFAFDDQLTAVSVNDQPAQVQSETVSTGFATTRAVGSIKGFGEVWQGRRIDAHASIVNANFGPLPRLREADIDR